LETAEELNCKIGILGLFGPLGGLYECGGELRENIDDIYTEFTRYANWEKECLSEMQGRLA
jgi:hypothetical protein